MIKLLLIGVNVHRTERLEHRCKTAPVCYSMTHIRCRVILCNANLQLYRERPRIDIDPRIVVVVVVVVVEDEEVVVIVVSVLVLILSLLLLSLLIVVVVAFIVSYHC